MERDLQVLQECIAQLKGATSFEAANAVAVKTMELRKRATNQSEDFKMLVDDIAKQAISKAEDLRLGEPKPKPKPVPQPEPEPEPELSLGLPPAMGAPRPYAFAEAALETGATYERVGEWARAEMLYKDTVQKLLALRGASADAAEQRAIALLTSQCIERLERHSQPPVATQLVPPPIWTPQPVVPVVPFVEQSPQMPEMSDEEEGGSRSAGAGGWFSWSHKGPSEAELAERKRADEAKREAAEMRAQIHAMQVQMSQLQQLLHANAHAAQHYKLREQQLRWELQRTREASQYSAEQVKQQELYSTQLISEGAAVNEIEAKTALQKHSNDIERARRWLEEQRKQQAVAKVDWDTTVTKDDYSNMEQVGPRPGLWFASRLVQEEEDGMMVEKSKKVVLKQFVLSDSVQPFLHRMACLQNLQNRIGVNSHLVLTPTLWFKDEESEAGVCTAYAELPRLETPVPLKDTAMCSDSAHWGAADEGDAPPDPGSRVELAGRSGEITMSGGFANGKVEVQWEDDFSTSRHRPSELTVVQTAMERYGGGTTMLDVPETFAAVLKGVMQLHAHGIIGVVSIDSVALEMGSSGVPRPVLTAGYSRLGIDKTSVSDTTIQAAAGAPEMQEAGAKWTEKTDIWVIGSLLHRALYGGKEPVLMPGKAQPSLPAAAGTTAQHGRDLTLQLLQRDPSARPTATAASSHPFFSGGAAVAALKEEGHVVAVETKLAVLRDHVELLRSVYCDRTLSLNVQRTSLVDSVLTELMAISNSQIERGELLRKLRVRFVGEDGIDAGGLTKELYTAFARELFDPSKCALFESCEGDGGTTPLFLPAAAFDGDPCIYEGVGRMLAMILVAGYPQPGQHGMPATPGIPISLPLAPSLLRFLLYQQPTQRDYAAFDPQSASSLQQVLEMENFDDMMMCMTFEDATDPSHPRHEEEVTEANRNEYAKLKVMHQLVSIRLPQLTALRKGFEAIKLRNQLRLFSVTELMDVMCRQQSVDAEEIIAALEFSGFPRGTRTQQYIKDTLRGWSDPSLKCFLRFITSMTCVPPDGGKIKILCVHGGNDAYPKSHTCFNRLDMPDYNSQAIVAQRLQFCVDNVDAAGFGEA